MKISDIFDVSYGINLELNKCDITCDKDGINFVSRTSQNNGVVAKVKRIEGKEPQPAGVLTCAGGGSVLSTFVQTEPFYSGRDLYILKPKKNMSLNEKLFYAMCIRENAYRYNYGRQANKTLKDIELPDTIPDWVNKVEIDTSILDTSIKESDSLDLNSVKWDDFKIGDLFDIVNGIKYPKSDRKSGNLPLVSTTAENNGISDYIAQRDEIYSNILTVAYSGSVGATFYHNSNVFIGETVFGLLPKFELNKYIGMFLCTILNHNNKKYDYGRKIIGSRYVNEYISLPSVDGKPNWTFIETYIKSLPYSDKL